MHKIRWRHFEKGRREHGDNHAWHRGLVEDKKSIGKTKAGEIFKKVLERILKWYGRLLNREEECVGKPSAREGD